MVGGVDPPAELAHGLGNGRRLSRTDEREGEITAHARQAPPICPHRMLVDVLQDLHQQQALHTELLENRFDRLFDLRALCQAHAPGIDLNLSASGTLIAD